MGISEGKILLYTAVGGVAPGGCVPVCLDVGTDRAELLEDPQYRGIRARRASGEVSFGEGGEGRESENGKREEKSWTREGGENKNSVFFRPSPFDPSFSQLRNKTNKQIKKQVLDSLVGELVGALKELLRREKASGGPFKQTRTTLLQFEDFASSSAFRLLEKFAPCGLPCFNDDVQVRTSALQARFAALGNSWQDQEHEKFAGEFLSTMKVLRKFVEVSEKHTPYLLRKAQRIEQYLDQR